MITCDPGCTFNPAKVSKVNPNHLLQMYYYDCHLSFRNVTVMKSSASCLETIASCVSVTVVSLLPYSASPYSESRFCFCQAFRAAPVLLQVWLLTQASTRLQRCFWCFRGGRAWNASHLIARTTPWLSSWALFHKQTGFCRLALSVYILLRIRAEQRERSTRHRLTWQMERRSRRGSQLSESGKTGSVV